MKTYVETLEESNEELSKRLAVAEEWIVWKSRYRFKFDYLMEVTCDDVTYFKHIARHVMKQELHTHRCLGDVHFIQFIKETYKYESEIKMILYRLCGTRNIDEFRCSHLTKILRVISV